MKTKQSGHPASIFLSIGSIGLLIAFGLNLVGLGKADYKGAPSTLCNGCGHDSMAHLPCKLPKRPEPT